MTTLHATILTLFPEMFPGPLGISLIGRALAEGKWTLECLNLRDFGIGRHKNVDDTPYGGGAGMVMRADVLGAAIDAALQKMPNAQLIYMSPRGVPLTQRLASSLIAPHQSVFAPHPSPLPREREFDSVPHLTPMARRLRRNQTDVEKLLWSKLRNKQLGDYKFRRQHPVGRYVVDFVCEDQQLVIELDGGQHSQEKDEPRTRYLESLGWRVIRFWNHEILENLDGVLEAIIAQLKAPPLPRERDGVRGEGSANLILICGRFEGIDERIINKYQPLEISLGDFVMTGGELAAMALLDCCVRQLQGVLGEAESLAQESFGLHEDYACLLEHPHYTKPPLWEGLSVPQVLLSGHHEQIDRWRKDQAQAITKQRRPDLLLTQEELKGIRP